MIKQNKIDLTKINIWPIQYLMQKLSYMLNDQLIHVKLE